MNPKNENYFETIKEGIDFLCKSKEFEKQVSYISNSIISFAFSL